MLRGIVVTGCLRSGITIYRQAQLAVADPTGPVYPPARPAALERVTAQGTIGVAVLLEPGTAAVLRGCLLADNGAPDPDACFRQLHQVVPTKLLHFPSGLGACGQQPGCGGFKVEGQLGLVHPL